MRRDAARRRARQVLTAGVVSGMTLGAVAGCATGGHDASAGRSTTSAAIEVCLTAAVENFDFPVDASARTAISVERDDQGWWAVRASVDDGTTSGTLTCTAVPDDGPAGARAASFSVTS